MKLAIYNDSDYYGPTFTFDLVLRLPSNNQSHQIN
jgi:hypothetical protein